MAERDPTIPQSDDPDLQADLVRLLRIVGPLGRLNIADFVIPTVSVGNLADLALQPSFRPDDIFTAGLLSGAGAFTIHATTGTVPRGVYDLQLYISPHISEAHVWELILATFPGSTSWFYIVPADGTGLNQTFALELARDGNLQIKNTTAFGVGIQSTAAIFARLRI